MLDKSLFFFFPSTWSSRVAWKWKVESLASCESLKVNHVGVLFFFFPLQSGGCEREKRSRGGGGVRGHVRVMCLLMHDVWGWRGGWGLGCWRRLCQARCTEKSPFSSSEGLHSCCVSTGVMWPGRETGSVSRQWRKHILWIHRLAPDGLNLERTVNDSVCFVVKQQQRHPKSNWDFFVKLLNWFSTKFWTVPLLNHDSLLDCSLEVEESLSGCNLLKQKSVLLNII